MVNTERAQARRSAWRFITADALAPIPALVCAAIAHSRLQLSWSDFKMLISSASILEIGVAILACNTMRSFSAKTAVRRIYLMRVGAGPLMVVSLISLGVTFGWITGSHPALIVEWTSILWVFAPVTLALTASLLLLASRRRGGFRT
jgi:hypothetical protein